jgi:5-methyltetrahydrofolate--homocysteine methyltransferase
MEKREFLDRLGSNILLFDGAIGTQVQARGLKIGESPEIWNLDYPERIEEIHRMYVDAGAMLVTTNTFGGSRIMLEKSGLGDKVTEINVQAAAIAKRAADGKALVAGSVGPTGEFLQPLGTVSPEEMKEDFYNQIIRSKPFWRVGLI